MNVLIALLLLNSSSVGEIHRQSAEEVTEGNDGDGDR